MASYNSKIGRIYSTPHSKNAWAWVTAAGGWRRIDDNSEDGHTNTHLVLTAARESGANVSVHTNAADDRITAVYL